MGQLTLPDIKRRLTCPVLFQNKKDYLKVNDKDAFFHIVYWEIMHWYSRKMRPVSPLIISSAISQHAAIHNINPIEEADYQLAFKDFVTTGLYSKMDLPLVNVQGQIGIKDNVIVYEIPTVTTYRNASDWILFTLPNTETVPLLRATYEARFAAIWAFYTLNRYPRLHNLYIKNSKIEHVEFKSDQKYVMTSIKMFANIINTLTTEQKTYPTTAELCHSCSWRDECPIRYL